MAGASYGGAVLASQPTADRRFEGNGRHETGQGPNGSATDRLTRVAALLGDRKYELAARTLLAIRSRAKSDHSAYDHAASLASRCQRLATDRGRLQRVIDDLQDDEETMRSEIASMLGLSLHYGPGPSSSATIPEPTTTEPTTPEPTIPEPPPVMAVDRPVKPGLSIWLLGSFRLAFQGDLLVGANAGRSSAVLRYLAALPAGGVHKEQLADRFWPDADPRTGRRNVHQAVYTIRRVLARGGAEDELVFANDHYALGHADRWRDVDELSNWLDAGRRARSMNDPATALAAHRRAYVIYDGEFLAEHPYDEWAEGARQHYRALQREAAATLLDHHRRSGDPCGRLEVANRLLSLDATDEDACRHLMAAHAELGQPHLAEMAFKRLGDVLQSDLGTMPTDETVTLAQALTETISSDES